MSEPTPRPGPRATGLTYDAGALIALERAARDAWAVHDACLRRGVRPTVPAPVLAQAWRGGPQPQLSRGLRGCRVAPMSEHDARAAGALLAASRTGDVVDATVVAGALRRRDAVVTSDPDDLRLLGDAAGAGLLLHRV